MLLSVSELLETYKAAVKACALSLGRLLQRAFTEDPQTYMCWCVMALVENPYRTPQQQPHLYCQPQLGQSTETQICLRMSLTKASSVVESMTNCPPHLHNKHIPKIRFNVFCVPVTSGC